MQGGRIGFSITRRPWLGSTSAFALSGAASGQDDFTKLPSNLPVPVDDGACDHLLRMRVPSLNLKATIVGVVNLADEKAKWTIVCCYPRTGEPGKRSPDGWDAIPGARGCPPELIHTRQLSFDSLRSQYEKRHKRGRPTIAPLILDRNPASQMCPQSGH